jgi:hypothetical protein
LLSASLEKVGEGPAMLTMEVVLVDAKNARDDGETLKAVHLKVSPPLALRAVFTAFTGHFRRICIYDGKMADHI